MKSVTYWIPTPRLIVGVAVSLALITFALKAGSGNATVNKLKGYLGLAV